MRFWVSTVSRAHVQNEIAGSFAEDGESRLKRMSPGDGIVFYSPRPDQRLTAIGVVADDAPQQIGDAWRRAIHFTQNEEVAIQPLIDSLDFIRDKKSWGVFFGRGFFEISESDFRTLERAMSAPIQIEAGALTSCQGGPP